MPDSARAAIHDLVRGLCPAPVESVATCEAAGCREPQVYVCASCDARLCEEHATPYLFDEWFCRDGEKAAAHLRERRQPPEMHWRSR